MSNKRVILAEYFVTEDSVILLVVREDSDAPESYEFPMPASRMRRFVVENFGGGESFRNVSDLDEDDWQRQVGSLVEPLTSCSDEGDTIWLVPHDVLHYVPLHALKVDGRHLIDRNPVCYTPSASVMAYCQGKRKSRRVTAAVFGDSVNDLSHARGEALSIATRFGTIPILGKRATKRAVRAALEQGGKDLDVAHFACHGYFDSSAPLKSGIVLAAEHDGIEADTAPAADVLTAEELLELEIGVTLLTLSACETGINERRPGDELIGLARSLIYAGAPSVVVSLWTVDDLSTRLLMERFYECLHQSLPEGDARFTKAEALQRAQQHVKSLTAREIFEWCDSLLASAEPDEFDTFSLDRAEAQALAGDVEPALAACHDVRHRLSDTTDEQTRVLLQRTERMVDSWRTKAESTPHIDYEVRPFNHLFHWAPFVLIGDWK